MVAYKKIYIIGCIGYPEQSSKGQTPVYVLDLADFSIQPFHTHGDTPDRLYQHEAEYIKQDHVILCRSGKMTHAQNNETADNIVTWQLCLKSGRWSQLAKKQYTRWRFVREDEDFNKLYEIGRVLHAARSGRHDKYSNQYREALLSVGYELDLNRFEVRYRPDIEHVYVPSGEYRQFMISIDGVIIRYDESSADIMVTVEGVLPQKIIKALKEYGLEIFSTIESAPYKIIEF